jgi:hypothetical protein
MRLVREGTVFRSYFRLDDFSPWTAVDSFSFPVDLPVSGRLRLIVEGPVVTTKWDDFFLIDYA